MHTPGPWTIVPYGDGDSLVIHSDDDNRVCFMATHGGSRAQWERIQENAALIAAAPDLYEALKAARQFIEDDVPPWKLGEHLALIDAALAKVSQQQGTPQAPVAPDSEATS